MNIDRVIVGELQTNCYIISKDNHVLVIDPGDEYSKIAKVINHRIIDGVVITHHHFDHVGAISFFKDANIFDSNNMMEGINTIGLFTFEVLYTPGHKEDAISLYFKDDKCIFVGDFIFQNSIGRTDLPGGDMDAMIDSIKKTNRFADDITIYPGHGLLTTFGHERRYNIYFK